MWAFYNICCIHAKREQIPETRHQPGPENPKLPNNWGIFNEAKAIARTKPDGSGLPNECNITQLSNHLAEQPGIQSRELLCTREAPPVFPFPHGQRLCQRLSPVWYQVNWLQEYSDTTFTILALLPKLFSPMNPSGSAALPTRSAPSRPWPRLVLSLNCCYTELKANL